MVCYDCIEKVHVTIEIPIPVWDWYRQRHSKTPSDEIGKAQAVYDLMQSVSADLDTINLDFDPAAKEKKRIVEALIDDYWK